MNCAIHNREARNIKRLKHEQGGHRLTRRPPFFWHLCHLVMSLTFRFSFMHGRCAKGFTLIESLIYADDHEGSIQVDSPLNRQKTWANILATNQNIKTYDLFVCPTYSPHRFTNWVKTYGVRTDLPTNAVTGAFREILRKDSVERPVDYMHVTDTTSRGRDGGGAQQYYSFRTISELDRKSTRLNSSHSQISYA